MTTTARIPGTHAGPYEGRCPKCRSYLCDCPVGFMGRLGYVWCVPCSVALGRDQDEAFEPVRIRNLDHGEECCILCGERLLPEGVRY